MHADWTPARFTAALSAIQRATGWSQGDIARIAGINRSQVSRWMRGQHRPAYGNVRQLAAAVFGDDPDLAQRLMASAGYAALDGQQEEPLIPQDQWERQVADDPDLPLSVKRSLIDDYRSARRAYEERRRAAGRATGRVS